MLRIFQSRWLPITVIITGLVIALLGVASATIWRPSGVVAAKLSPAPTQPVVITRANVLNLLNPNVEVVAKGAADQDVFLAVGRATDVKAWSSTEPALEIKGLSSWKALDTTEVAGTKAKTEAAKDQTPPATDPRGSDMWVQEVTGKGTATLKWSDRQGEWALLAATDGKSPAPTVELRWKVPVSTPWLWPLVIVGIVLLILGGLWLGRNWMRRPAPKKRAVVEAPAAAALAAPQDGVPQDGVAVAPDGAGSLADQSAPAAWAASGETPADQMPASAETVPVAEDEAGDGPEMPAEDAAETPAEEVVSDAAEEAAKAPAKDVAEAPAEPALVVPELAAPATPAIAEEAAAAAVAPVAAVAAGRRARPSRRALREARERGEAAIVVDGEEFPTGLIPVVAQVAEDPEGDEAPQFVAEQNAVLGHTADGIAIPDWQALTQRWSSAPAAVAEEAAPSTPVEQRPATAGMGETANWRELADSWMNSTRIPQADGGNDAQRPANSPEAGPDWRELADGWTGPEGEKK